MQRRKRGKAGMQEYEGGRGQGAGGRGQGGRGQASTPEPQEFLSELSAKDQAHKSAGPQR